MKIQVITLSTGDVATFVNGRVLITLESDQEGQSPMDVAERLAKIFQCGVQYIYMEPPIIAHWNWDDVITLQNSEAAKSYCEPSYQRIRLTIDVGVVLNSAGIDEVCEYFQQFAHSGYANGLFTGNTDAEVDNITVSVIPVAPEDRALVEMEPNQANNDYVLAPEAKSVWIKVQNTVLHIQQQIHMVRVDVHAHGIDNIANMMEHHFIDSEEAHLTDIGINDSTVIADWMMNENFINFFNLSFRGREQSIQDYVKAHSHQETH